MPASSQEAYLPDADHSRKWRFFWYAVALACVYSAAHIAARVLASPNLGEDDPLTNVLVQSLRPGYSVWQPPLFEWVMWATQQLTGPSLLGFQIVKYGFLVATIGAVYLCAFKLTRDAVWSVITAEAVTLIYHVGWRFHEGFTGIVPAMFFSVVALLCVLRIVERPRSVDFALLGVSCGLGLLSAHNFALQIAALAVASLLVGPVRRCLWRRQLALTVVAAGVMTTPYYMWIVSDPGRVAELGAIRSIFTHSNPNFTLWKVMRKTLGAPFGFYWSLLIFLLAASWRRVIDHFKVRIVPPIDWAERPLHLFLAWYAVGVFGLLFLSGVAVSYVRYANHDLLAVLLPTLVLMFALIHLLQPSAQEVRRWSVFTLAIILFAFAARAANMFVMEPVCKICRWGIPYAPLAAKLRDAGLSDRAIVSFEPELAGNLRLQLPNNRIELVKSPNLLRSERRGRVALVWQVGGRFGLRLSEAQMLERLRAADIHTPPQEIRIPWQHLFRETGYRHTVWRFVIVE